MAEPLRAEQGGRLGSLLMGHQAEMGVDHVQLIPAELDLDPERAPRLQPPDGLGGRQRARALQAERKGAEDRVAVALLLHLEGRMEVELHAEQLGDGVGLVDPAGAGAPDIQLLQRDDVGPALGDDPGRALQVERAVHADATVDVIGQDAWHRPWHRPWTHPCEGAARRPSQELELRAAYVRERNGSAGKTPNSSKRSQKNFSSSMASARPRSSGRPSTSE